MPTAGRMNEIKLFSKYEPSCNSELSKYIKKIVLNKRFHFVIEISQIFKTAKRGDDQVQSLAAKKKSFSQFDDIRKLCIMENSLGAWEM